MDFHRVRITAKRFIRRQLRSGAFWLLVLLPLAGAIFLPFGLYAVASYKSGAHSENGEGPPASKVAILYEPRLQAGAELLKSALELPEENVMESQPVKVTLIAVTEDGLDELLKQQEKLVLRGEISAYVLLATVAKESGGESFPRATLFVEPLSFLKTKLKSRLAIASSLFGVLEIEQAPERKFELSGDYFGSEFDIAALDKTERRQRVFVSTLMILFIFAAQVANSAVSCPMCAGLTREKDQNTIEVLLCTFSCEELVAGRLLGALALSVPIILGYTLIAALVGVFTGVFSLAAVAWLYPLFFLDCAFYASAYFFVGSIAHSRESATRLSALLSFFTLAGTFAMIYTLTAPNSELARTFCRIPLIATTTIPVRVAIGSDNNYGEYALTLVATALLAGAVFCAIIRIVDKEVLIVNRKMSYFEMLRRLWRGRQRWPETGPPRR